MITQDVASGLRWTGACADLSVADRRELFERASPGRESVRVQTADIISRIRLEGDRALRQFAEQFDSVVLDALEVPETRWSVALDGLGLDVRRAMEHAAANIQRVHKAFLPCAQEVESEPGVVVGRRPDPLTRVGVYAPGGRAAYPSSVLMGVIPARAAGVAEIVLCSPPVRETGLPSDTILAAAKLAGATRVFSLGGAGAVAAMAYGTETVPRVDRIVGPGNAYVAEAKIQVASVVGIDSPAGPSELLVIGDDTADPALVARELLAQAEHDPHAAVVAVMTTEALATAVASAMDALLASQPRAEIVRAALAGQGAVLFSQTLDAAVEFANAYAAEHVLLLVASPDAVLSRLRNAGSVFLGQYSSVAFGDYMTGANHVLPTAGSARSYSGLSTFDFVRWTSYQRVSRDAAARLAHDVGVFADVEGLGGHAIAARAWHVGARP